MDADGRRGRRPDVRDGRHVMAALMGGNDRRAAAAAAAGAAQAAAASCVDVIGAGRAVSSAAATRPRLGAAGGDSIGP